VRWWCPPGPAADRLRASGDRSPPSAC
jgi:hypothetical protein